MRNPIKQLKELDAKFHNIMDRDPVRVFNIFRKIILGAMISSFSATALILIIPSVARFKENKDFQNGKFNPVIKEANVLSVSRWTNKVKVDINGNGKFDKGDVSFFDGLQDIAANSQSIVYIDGVGKMKPLAYKRENGEYVIYRDTFTYLKNSENLNKEFYDYMKDKKVFDLAKIKKEIDAHTK